VTKKSKLNVGVVTVSDRASNGEYEDRGGPAIIEWLAKAIKSDWGSVKRVIPDEQYLIEDTLKQLALEENCQLIITTGGTGPAKRDVTPDATENICQKMMPGFGELMRMESLKVVPTAILSRQTAGIYESSLIINMPGKPSAISDCFNAIFPAVPYCIDLLNGPYIECNETFVTAFRPKHAQIRREKELNAD